MEIDENKNIIIFSIDEMLKIRKYFPLDDGRLYNLLIEGGIKPVEGSWTKYNIINKQKLMLFKIKYGF